MSWRTAEREKKTEYRNQKRSQGSTGMSYIREEIKMKSREKLSAL